MSDVLGIPANVASTFIFDPRSNPVSLAFDRFTGPVVTSRSSGPLMFRSILSVPSFSAAPAGRITPSAGSSEEMSVAGMLLPLSFICTDVVCPVGLVGSRQLRQRLAHAHVALPQDAVLSRQLVIGLIRQLHGLRRRENRPAPVAACSPSLFPWSSPSCRRMRASRKNPRVRRCPTPARQIRSPPDSDFSASRVAFSGVCCMSVWFSGPAWPLSEMFPFPGVTTARSKGNCVV